MSKCEACSWENERVSRLDRYAIAAMQGMLSSETAGAGVALPCEPRRDGEFEMLANRADCEKSDNFFITYFFL